LIEKGLEVRHQFRARRVIFDSDDQYVVLNFERRVAIKQFPVEIGDLSAANLFQTLVFIKELDNIHFGWLR